MQSKGLPAKREMQSKGPPRSGECGISGQEGGGRGQFALNIRVFLRKKDAVAIVGFALAQAPWLAGKAQRRVLCGRCAHLTRSLRLSGGARATDRSMNARLACLIVAALAGACSGNDKAGFNAK